MSELRCPIAIVDGDFVWRCQLNYGHRQWHQSFEHGNPGMIWPHDLGIWAEPEPVVEEVPLVPSVVVEEKKPKVVVERTPPRCPIRFSPEDWMSNEHLCSGELLHAYPQNYGIPPESALWWDDEFEAVRNWESESGPLGKREILEIKLARARWR